MSRPMQSPSIQSTLLLIQKLLNSDLSRVGIFYVYLTFPHFPTEIFTFISKYVDRFLKATDYKGSKVAKCSVRICCPLISQCRAVSPIASQFQLAKSEDGWLCLAQCRPNPSYVETKKMLTFCNRAPSQFSLLSWQANSRN